MIIFINKNYTTFIFSNAFYVFNSTIFKNFF
nr:MAG TPA: hypothetical protein [Caudoviricetes sp.]